jgi:glutathione S-transferase
MKLYYHPLSTYSQKVLIALYEKGVPFTPQVVFLPDPAQRAEYAKIHPLAKLPLLVDEARDWSIPESSIIIEYLDAHGGRGAPLIPEDRELARQTRWRDRLIDCYVLEPLAKIITDRFRPEGSRDPFGVAAARATLEKAYDLIDGGIARGKWPQATPFTLADCAFASTLLYADKMVPFGDRKHLRAYAAMLAERPSVRRAMQEAEPHIAQIAQLQ